MSMIRAISRLAPIGPWRSHQHLLAQSINFDGVHPKPVPEDVVGLLTEPRRSKWRCELAGPEVKREAGVHHLFDAWLGHRPENGGAVWPADNVLDAAHSFS